MKKSLSLMSALLGLGLMLAGAGCTNKLEGTWVSDKPVDGSTITLEFTKSRLTGSGERTDASDPAKKSNFKVSVDYTVTRQVQNVYEITISNPEVRIVGNLADDKQQTTWQEQGKTYLNKFSTYSFAPTADGKTMTLNSLRTGEINFHKN
jgi:hypothetical protein